MLKEVKYIKEEGKNLKGKQDQHDNEKSDIIGVIIKSFIRGGKRIWCCSFKIEAFILKLVSLLPLWVLCGSQYLCHINYFEYPVSLPGHTVHTSHLVIITIISSYQYSLYSPWSPSPARPVSARQRTLAQSLGRWSQMAPPAHSPQPPGQHIYTVCWCFVCWQIGNKVHDGLFAWILNFVNLIGV